jgi:hypothetical protein
MSNTILWEEQAKKVLLGKKIVMVRYMTEEEMQETGFQNVGIVIELNDGTIIWPTSDNEGNNSGAIHYAINSDSQKDYVIPNL